MNPVSLSLHESRASERRSATVAREDTDDVPPAGAELDPAWQRLWFSMLDTPWNSLAIVPADEAVPFNRVGDIVVAMGQEHGERSIQLIDARGVRMTDVHGIVEAIRVAGRDSRVVTVVDSLWRSPAAMHIARVTSAALVVARIGGSRVDTAKATVLAIGPQRVLGAVALI